MSIQVLPPATVGELVGLRSAAMVTGDHTAFRARVLELHRRDGWSFAAIGAPIGLTPSRVKAMAQQADRSRS